MIGGRVREEKMARWENLINTDTVTSCSPPTKAGRIDFRPPTRLLSTGQQGIPITVATLLAVDMDLTQQTHGTLLATLSFNNRYPSSSCLSPSINSVSSVCGFLCLSLLPPFLFLLTHTLTIFCSTIQATIPDFQGAIEDSFNLHSLLGFHTLIQYLPLLLCLLLFSSLHH